MKIVFIGAVEGSSRALRAMIEEGVSPALVVTLTEDLAKRHSDFVDLEPNATDNDIPVMRVRNINDADAIAAIGATAPDYIFIVGWSQICGPEFMKIAPGRVIGYHPAALPRLRGRATLPWTILNDEKITGGSLFVVDDGVDTGDILEQRFFHVAPRETARTLYDKHMLALESMIRASLASLAAGDPVLTKQDDACATYAARRRPEDGRIDWAESAKTIDRLIRAVGRPYPGAFTNYGDKHIVIWRAHHLDQHAYHGSPGQIVDVADHGFDVLTGDGLLRVEEWEGEGLTSIRNHEVLGR